MDSYPIECNLSKISVWFSPKMWYQKVYLLMDYILMLGLVMVTWETVHKNKWTARLMDTSKSITFLLGRG